MFGICDGVRTVEVESVEEVVGKEAKVEGDTTYIRRIDGYIIDVPTANIITSESIS